MNNHLTENTWIEASAGTGKTKSLIDRILTLLLCGTHPREILCITFTNAAAMEITSRIYEITEQLEKLSDDEIVNFFKKISFSNYDIKNIKACRLLYKQIIEDEIQIHTIHSFCFSIIRQFPSEFNIVNPKILTDESKILSLIDLAINHTINQASEDTFLHESLNFLTNTVEEYSIKKLLRNLIKQREHFDFSSINPELLAQKYADFFGIDTESILNFYDFDKFELEQKYLNSKKYAFDKLVLLLQEGEDKDMELASTIHDYFLGNSQTIEKLLDSFLTKKDRSIRTRLLSASLLKKCPDASIALEEVCKYIENATEFVKTVLAAKLGFAYCLVTKSLISNYEKLKLSENLFEYNDLLLLVKKTFDSRQNDWILFKINSSTSHILIDEAQDTSQIQWDIIKLITDDFYSGNSDNMNKSLFVVGDPKQSIYSFQGADLKHFLDTKSHFKKRIENAQLGFTEIYQDKSYRASALLLNFVDNIFAKNKLSKALTGENKDILHHSNRPNDLAEIEIWPLVKQKKTVQSDNWEIPDHITETTNAQFILAKKIAQHIKDKIETQTFLPSKNRAALPQDFAIIFQRRKHMAVVVRALKDEGIPVSGIDKLKLVDNILVQDALALIKFTLFPYDNLNLAALLKSPFCNISEDDLFELCLDTSFECTIFDKIKATNNELCTRLTDWIHLAQKSSPYEFLKLVLEEYRRAFVTRLGLDSNDIIDELISHALKFEDNEISPDLFQFFYFMQNSELEMSASYSNKNAVTITTVHGSKGLQFPCVILPDTTSKNVQIENFIFQNGILLIFSNSSNIPIKLQTIKKEEERKREEEYFRLLYVAITRSEDALYIAGTKEAKSDRNNWYNAIARSVDAETTRPGGGAAGENAAPAGKGDTTAGEDAIPAVKDDTTAGEDAATEENEPIRIGGLKSSIERTVYQQKTFHIPDFINNKLYINHEVKTKEFTNKEILIGNIVHLLLSEFNLDIDKTIFNKKAISLIDKFAYIIGPEKNEILQSINNVINLQELNWIFGKNTMSEVPFILKKDTTSVGRIDKLIISDATIDIVDIKTGKQNAGIITPSIKHQMHFYKEFATAIYHSKPVRCHILWTAICTLQSVPDKA